jgi:hypothetical protein
LICFAYADFLSGYLAPYAWVHLWGGVTRLSAQRAGRSGMPGHNIIGLALCKKTMATGFKMAKGLK